MKKLVFYLAIFVVGILGWLYATHLPPPTQADAVSQTTSSQPQPISSSSSAPPPANLAALETQASKVLATWDTDNKTGKGMSDAEVYGLISAITLASNNSLDSQADGLVRHLNAKRDKRAADVAAKESAAAAQEVADNDTGRQSYASTLEQTYLKNGMDVTVRTSGAKGSTLTIKYMLLGRPDVYQLVNDDSFLPTLKGLGFRRVVFTDGYDATWSYDIVKNKFL